MKWTLDQALTNWRICFDEGLLSAARDWWLIVMELESEAQ